MQPDSGVGIHKGIAWDDVPLGQRSDGVLARELGVSRASVYAARRARGIPTYKSQCLLRAEPMLGQASDDEVGRRFDLSAKTVATRRRELGIAPYRSPPPAPTSVDRGVYWLGVFRNDGDALCECPRCLDEATGYAVFLLRSQPLVISVCGEHAQAVKQWVCEASTEVVRELMLALRRGSRPPPPGRLVSARLG